MKRLLFFVLVGWVLGLVLFGCAGSRQKGPDQVRAEPLLPMPALDSIVVQPARSLFERALGIHRPAQTYEGTTSVQAGKKATISFFYAPATITNAGKKSQVAAGPKAAVLNSGKKGGPQIQADSGAQVAAVGQGIGQAGDGNVATMPAPAGPPTLWQRLGNIWRAARWPLIILGSLAGVAALIMWLAPASGLGLLLLGARRNNS